MWFVYILQCADETLYTGITTDLERRLHEHNYEKLGAKYVKSRRPASLVFSCKCDTKKEVCKEEYRIKQLSRKEKLKLLKKYKKK